MVKFGIMSLEFIIEGEENIMFKFGWMDKEEVRKVINVIKDVFNVIVVEFVLIDVNKGLISEMWVLKKLREFVMRIMLVY